MKFVVLSVFLSFYSIYFSQIRYYFQGFENVTATCPENWSYSGGVRNNQTSKSGSYSNRIGRLGESNTLTFNAVNISMLSNPQLILNHSVLGGNGPGMDVREGAIFLISLDGGAFIPVAKLAGTNDHSYAFTALGGVGVIGCAAPNDVTYQIPNAFTYSIPTGTNTIALQVMSINIQTGANAAAKCTNFVSMMTNATPTASNYDRNDEGIYIDDVSIWADGPSVSNNGPICTGNTLNLSTLNVNSALSFNWSGPNSFSSTQQNPTVSISATNAMTGQYSNAITFQSCTIATLSTSVIVNASPTVSISGQTTFCNGTSTTLTASGGGTYTWSNSLGNSAAVSVNASGTYVVNVAGSNGCISSDSISVNSVSSATNLTTITACDSYIWTINGQTYTASGTFTSVNGCVTETLDLTIASSTSNSTSQTACDSYTWSQNGQTYTTSGTYTNVVGCHTEILNLTITPSTSHTTAVSACNTYTWSVNGQTYSTSGTYTNVIGCLTEILNLTITTSTSNTTTVSACNTYTWAINGQTYSNSGTFTQVIGCLTEILDLTIVSNPVLSFNNPTVCQGQQATLTVSSNQNGTTYLWSNGQTTNSITISPASTTSYSVLGTNETGCSSSGNGTVSVTQNPIVQVADVSICEGNQAVLTAIPAVAGGTFLWSNGQTTNSITVIPSQTTQYSVAYTNNSCQSALTTATVSVNPMPIISVTNPTVCGGASSVISASSSISGGTYTWFDGSHNSTTNLNAFQDTSVNLTYNVNGCSVSTDVAISVLPLPNVQFTASQFTGCAPLSVTFENTSEESTNASWYINNQQMNAVGNSFTFVFENANCYDIALKISGTNGCFNTLTMNDMVCVHPIPVADFTYHLAGDAQNTANVIFDNSSSNSLLNWWDFGDGETQVNQNSPIHTFVYENNAEYTVTLVVESEFGCRDSVQQVLSFQEELSIYIPNAFTPDGTGINEIWQPIFSTKIDEGKYECCVYNRWGERVFYTTNYHEGWDGKFLGEIAQVGSYSYSILYKTIGNATAKTLTGHINLMR
jgi:gliding motility-associated-like protein